MNKKAKTETPPKQPTGRPAGRKGLEQQLDLTTLQRAPGFMIRLLQLQIFEEFFEFFAELGLSPAEHSILMIVRDNPSVTQSKLAAALRIQLPNLVKILAKLETSSVISRKRATTDKRAVELTLTSKGKRLTEQAARLADDFNLKMLSALNENEREQFLRTLIRLVRL